MEEKNVIILLNQNCVLPFTQLVDKLGSGNRENQNFAYMKVLFKAFKREWKGESTDYIKRNFVIKTREYSRR